MLGKRRAEGTLAPSTSIKRARVGLKVSTLDRMQREHYLHLFKRYCNFLHFGTPEQRQKDHAFLTKYAQDFHGHEQVMHARAYFLSNMHVRLQTILHMKLPHTHNQHITHIYQLWQCTPPSIGVMTTAGPTIMCRGFDILINHDLWDLLGRAAAPRVMLQSLSPAISPKSSVQKAAKEWLFDRNVFRIIFDMMRHERPQC